MPQSARVQSIDAIRAFRATLLKFAHAADSALADAEGEMTHTLTWLQTEQPAYWRVQVRKRTEILTRAKEALRMKRLFKDASGRFPSADEEQKAVHTATRRLEEAQQKLQTIKKWEQRLHHEINSYQGAARRLATRLQSDLPRAAAHLDKTVQQLEAYVSLSGPPPQSVESAADSSMARPAEPEEQSTNEKPPTTDN